MLVYNSLTFQKEEFKPITPGKVLMYVCGPTVYDSPHLGHAKSAVAFDIIRRYLEFKGYDMNIVKNYTDIDDKIIKRAKEKDMDYKELSETYINEYEDIGYHNEALRYIALCEQEIAKEKEAEAETEASL